MSAEDDPAVDNTAVDNTAVDNTAVDNTAVDNTAVESPAADTAAIDDKALVRQEQIWAGLYGPPGAAELVAKARAARQQDPGADIAGIIRSVEPDDDSDPDEAGTMRPGVG